MIRLAPPLVAIGLLAAGETILHDQRYFKLLVEFGALGVLAWYCYYVTRTAIPGMQQRHHDEVVTLTQHHEEVVDKVVDRWSEFQKQSHEDSVRAIEAVAELTVKCGDVIKEARNNNGRDKA